VIEQHILGLIKADLMKLKDDQLLQQYIAEEIARLSGNDDDARQQLQRRLSELDQQMAKLRDHLKALDVATATALGFYDEARAAAAERQQVEEQLGKLARKMPERPDMSEIASRANSGLERLEAVFAEGTVDEQKELVRDILRAVIEDESLVYHHKDAERGLRFYSGKEA